MASAELKRNESKLRRKVQDAIQELIDDVAEDLLSQKLPFLDCSSWDEVVEERYLGKLCGLPICTEAVEHTQSHKYHIDRRSNKIFEVCKERSKFCSERCFDASVAIRSQLDAEPLWITGETTKRIGKKYTVVRPKNLVEELPSEKLLPAPVKAKSSKVAARNVEVVREAAMATLNDLKIAERDGGSSADEEEPGSEKHAAGEREDSDEEIVLKKNEDEEFKDCLSRFASSIKIDGLEKMCTTTYPAPVQSPRQQTSSSRLKLTQEEQEKLDRIRAKYSRKAQARAPIIIDAPMLSAKRASETNRAESIRIKEEMGTDGERVGVSAKPEAPLMVDPTTIITPCSSKDAELVVNIVKQWWTDRSTSFLKSGGFRPANDIDKMLRRFLAGEKGGDIELEDVNLPDVDVVNVDRRRLQILLQSLKPAWLLMERKLAIRSSELSSLSSLLGTFRLTADNIAGFERQQIRLIIAVLFRFICRFTDSLEEDYFPGGFFSKEICEYLEFSGVEEPAFARIWDELLPLIQ